MNCSKCSKEIPNETKFCPECGNPTSVEVPAAENKEIPPKKQPSKFQSCLGCLGLMFIILFIGSCLFGGDDKKSDDVKSTSSAVQETSKEKIHTIGITPEQFKERFNSASTAVKTDLLINNLVVEAGDVQNVFSYDFNDNLVIMGTINKANGMIRDVSILAQPSKDNAIHNANIFLVFACLIGAVNSDLPPSERGQILKELGFLDKGADLTKLDKRTVRGNIQYSASFLANIGFMFTAKNIDDK